MKVPLILDTVTISGAQYIKIWFNGKYSLIKSPILPFAYTKKFPPLESKNEIVKRRLLYDIDNEIELYKCSFRTTYEMKECCNKENFYESDFKFRDRIYTNCEELISSYANTNDLNIMYLDFEMSTENGQFCKSDKDAIIAAGYKFNNEQIELILSDVYNNDYLLLVKLQKLICDRDPDIICTFNGTFFDIPYFIDRCKKYKIDTTFLTRDGSEPFITDKYIKLGGRIHYDLYTRSVAKDQKLFEKRIPDRKMKTVCKAYNLADVVEEPEDILGNMKNMVGTEELKKYLFSDLRCTEFLCKLYLPGIIALSEIIGVSLESCINSSPSYIGQMLFSKHYERVGIVSDLSVGDAYPELASKKRGGISLTYRPGLYKHNLHKLDIQSDYPNLIRTLNLSPETCRFLDFKHTLEPFNAYMNHEKQYLTVSIPDEISKLQLIIGVDFSKRGFASTFVDNAMNNRLQMKEEMKNLDKNSVEYANLDVNQLQTKIILNSITGMYGQKYASFGSLACYCMITGCARHIINNLIDFLGGVISIDTDGVYTDSDVTIDDANTWLENFMYTTFQMPQNYMKLEKDDIYAGYFRPDEEKAEDAEVKGKAKNYLLIEEDKNKNKHIIVHGSSFQGTHLIKLYKNIIEDIGYKMLTTDINDKSIKDNLKLDIDNYYDKSKWTLDLLKISYNCKPISEYKNESDVRAQLVAQYQNRFKCDVRSQTRLSCIKVKQKHGSTYKLVTGFDKIEDIFNIDYDYYENITTNAFKRLNLFTLIPSQRTVQKGLFDF